MTLIDTATTPIDRDELMARLQVANQRRFARAAIRRHLRAAPNRAAAWARLADLLEEGFIDEAQDMRVSELLRACHGTGEHATVQILAMTGCSGTRRVGRLNSGEKKRLTFVLRCGNLRDARDAAFGARR